MLGQLQATAASAVSELCLALQRFQKTPWDSSVGGFMVATNQEEFVLGRAVKHGRGKPRGLLDLLHKLLAGGQQRTTYFLQLGRGLRVAQVKSSGCRLIHVSKEASEGVKFPGFLARRCVTRVSVSR